MSNFFQASDAMYRVLYIDLLLFSFFVYIYAKKERGVN